MHPWCAFRLVARSDRGSCSARSARIRLGAELSRRDGSRWSVPYTPGSGFDIVARTVGQKLPERWGQPIVVDNKAGASGTIGTEAVANAAPDGYTLLVTGGPHTIYPA